MREILFRGQCCTDGKWVEGYLGIEVPDELVIQQFSFDEYFKSNCIDQYSVKPETVGQYTGLKDLHGTRIFEGDIVKVYDVYCNETVVGVVEFCDGSFRIYDTDFTSYDRWMYYKVEVIGNVFDNPELLEVKEHE